MYLASFFLLFVLQVQAVNAANDTEEDMAPQESIYVNTCPQAMQFQCADLQCIDFEKQCDCKEDCDDGSDEEADLCKDLMYDKFVCDNGDCVSISSHCDCYKDCKDGSDEKKCKNRSCRECDNGDLYPSYGRCDCMEDCKDKSDEENCANDEANQRFLCADKECIPESARCDSIEDCWDGSDEKNCGAVLIECFKCESMREGAISTNEACEEGIFEELPRVPCFQFCEVTVTTQSYDQSNVTFVTRGCVSLHPEPDSYLDDKCYDLTTDTDISNLYPKSASSFSLPKGTVYHKSRLCNRAWCNAMNATEPNLCEKMTYEDGSNAPGLLKSGGEEAEESGSRKMLPLPLLLVLAIPLNKLF